MQAKKIITPTILMVSMVSLFTDVASEMLYPVMPVFLQTIGFSVVWIGVLEGLAELVAGISKGYFGQYSDALQKRVPFIRTGYALSAISKPMMAFFVWPWWIFLSRTIDRLGKGIRTSARDALLSSETSEANKGRVFGFHRSMDSFGAAIGPLIAMAWLWFNPGNYKSIFLLAFIPGIVAVGLTFLIRESTNFNPASAAKPPGLFSFLGYWAKAGKEYRFLSAGLLAFALFNSSDAFLLLAAKNRGMPDTTIIACYVGYNLCYTLLSYPLGRLGDRIGFKRVMLAGLFVFALVYAGFSFANASWHFMALFFLYAVYAASVEGIAKAWLSNKSKREEVGTALGFYNSLSSVFAFFASAAGGLIWYYFGPAAMFLFSASGVLLVAAFLSKTIHESRQELNSQI